MSQPCTAVELLLVDVRTLDVPATREIIALAGERAIACGCLSPDPHVANAIAVLNLADAFDFWFGGDGHHLPIERALALMTVDTPRVLLISDDPHARQQAGIAGIQAIPSSTPDIDRMLG